MIDIQAGRDSRGIDIPDVGIAGLRHVVTSGDRDSPYRGVAHLDLGVHLPASRRGTHMSRLVELVLEQHEELTVEGLPVVAKRLVSLLDATSGCISVAFPLVLTQASPVTKRPASNVHDAKVRAAIAGDDLTLEVAVEVIATSLCPCSKAISQYGAHNQRSRVTVAVAVDGGDGATRLPTLADLVRWAEEACSCPTYPLLKRPDERHVTMQAYDHPVFVEDIVRDVARRALTVPGPGRFRVRVVNEESIHRHDAYASVSGVLG